MAENRRIDTGKNSNTMKHLQRFTVLIALAAMTLNTLASAQPKDTVTMADIMKVAATAHPRLIMDAKDFKAIGKMVRKDIRKGRETPLAMVHRSIMDCADKHLEDSQLKYYKDASGRRILHVSRDAESRILSLAYAYRMTGERKYLDRAREDMMTVCSFSDWNPSHYLDVAEMSTAVAFGFDWLYDGLDESSRKVILNAIKEKALDTRAGQDFYKMGNNWNQVCNSGMVAAAVATSEFFPEDAHAAMNDMLKSNPWMMKRAYEPDGAYCEGPGYWEYGTSFEVQMLAVLDKAFGTDFGLSDTKGFDRTMDYMVFTNGNTGKRFNYSDNSDRIDEAPSLWYFAARFDKAPMMFKEVEYLKEHGYSNRILPVFVKYVAEIDPKAIVPPTTMTYSGISETPVVMTRTGWNHDDLYLGLKGGKGDNSHGHMDAGSFVFDAFGSRWSMDMNVQAYEQVENLLKGLGGNYWSPAQNSMRYQLTRLNNRFHSTITVNGQDHVVNGMATLEEVFDTQEARGGKLNMTKVFGNALESAMRTVVIADGDHLEVTDSFRTGADKASIRWSMTTPAEPEICSDGIILRQNGVTMKLSAPGSSVAWKVWSADPHDYPGELHQGEATYPVKVWIVGYETCIPANAETAVQVKLAKE